MIATEVLCRILNEHGAEWRRVPYYLNESKNDETIYKGNGFGWCTYLPVNLEQVIATTLEHGTCHINVQDNLIETEGTGDVWLECDKCHWQMLLEPSTPQFNYCPNCGAKVEKNNKFQECVELKGE